MHDVWIRSHARLPPRPPAVTRPETTLHRRAERLAMCVTQPPSAGDPRLLTSSWSFRGSVDHDSGDLGSPKAHFPTQALLDPPGGGTGPQYTYDTVVPPLPPISEKTVPEITPAPRDTPGSAAAGRSMPRAPATGTLDAAAAFTDPFDGLHEGSPTKPIPGGGGGSTPRGRTPAEGARTGSGSRGSRGSSPASVSLSPPSLARQRGASADADTATPPSPPAIKRPPGFYSDIMQQERAPVRWPPDNTVEVFRGDGAAAGHPQLSEELPDASDTSDDDTDSDDEDQQALLNQRHGTAAPPVALDGAVPLRLWQRHTLDDVPEDSAELGPGASYGVAGSSLPSTPSGGDRPVAEALAGAHAYHALVHMHGIPHVAAVRTTSHGVPPAAAPAGGERRRSRRHKSPLRRLTSCLACSATNSGFEAFSDELPAPMFEPEPVVPAVAAGGGGASEAAQRHAHLPAPQPVLHWASGSGTNIGNRTARSVTVPPLRLLEPRATVIHTTAAHSADPDDRWRRPRAPARQSVDVATLRRQPRASTQSPTAAARDPLPRATTFGCSLAGDLFGSPLHPAGAALETRGGTAVAGGAGLPPRGPVAEATVRSWYAAKARAAQRGAAARPRAGPVAEATVGLLSAETPSLQSVRIGVVTEAPPRGASLARGRLDFELRRDIMEGKFSRKLCPQVDYWGNKDLALMICRAVLGRDVMDGCEIEEVADESTRGALFAEQR